MGNMPALRTGMNYKRGRSPLLLGLLIPYIVRKCYKNLLVLSAPFKGEFSSPHNVSSVWIHAPVLRSLNPRSSVSSDATTVLS